MGHDSLHGPEPCCLTLPVQVCGISKCVWYVFLFFFPCTNLNTTDDLSVLPDHACPFSDSILTTVPSALYSPAKSNYFNSVRFRLDSNCCKQHVPDKVAVYNRVEVVPRLPNADTWCLWCYVLCCVHNSTEYRKLKAGLIHSVWSEMVCQLRESQSCFSLEGPSALISSGCRVLRCEHRDTCSNFTSLEKWFIRGQQIVKKHAGRITIWGSAAL